MTRSFCGRLLMAALSVALPALANAQVATIPGVSQSGTVPTGFQAQGFKLDCNNVVPTSGQCWPLMEIWDATTQVTVDATSHGLKVFLAGGAAGVVNPNGAAAPGSASPVTPSNQPVGGATIANGQVSCSTSSTALVAARTGVAGTGRVSVTVTNLGTNDVYIGVTGVTTSTGNLLVGVKGASVTYNTQAALFCVAGSAQSVSFLENF